MQIKRCSFAGCAAIGVAFFVSITLVAGISGVDELKCKKGSADCMNLTTTNGMNMNNMTEEDWTTTQNQKPVVSEDTNDQEMPLSDVTEGADREDSMGSADGANGVDGGGADTWGNIFMDSEVERDVSMDDDTEGTEEEEVGKDADGTDTPLNMSVRQSGERRRSFIRVRADDTLLVYVNGNLREKVQKRHGTKKISRRLGRGDVVAFVAINRFGWGGALIDVVHKGRHHYSGVHGGYKTSTFPVSRGWKTKSNASCSWRRPKVLAGGRKGTLLKRAKYIWDKRAPKISSIAIRYVVGGEKCVAVPTASPNPIQTYIRVRANDYVVVFLNGYVLRTVFKKDGARKIRVRLRRRDVVSFKVVNRHGWGGVLIDVFHNGRHHYSGRSRSFKARKHSLLGRPRIIAASWTAKSFSSCKWKAPKKISGGVKTPFPARAKYIWAKGTPKKARVAVRYVVGGERCTTGGSSIRIRTSFVAHVHLNGKYLQTVKKSHGVKMIPARLKRKDVVAFTAVSRSPWAGVLIDVVYAGKHHYSGISRFYKARPLIIPGRGLVARNWRKKSFSSCFWRQPRKIAGGVKRPGFPNRAKYIWAKGAAKKSTVLIRHAVGGEACWPRPKPPPTFIWVRADDYVAVYVNGRWKKTVSKAQKARKIPVPLREGDVIAFKVVNRLGWGGVLIDIFYKRRHHYSGINGNYKAIKYAALGAVGKRRFATKRLSSCLWRKPKVILGGPKFPFSHHAQYIWAKGAPKQSKVVVRYVVGGETCVPKPTTKPTTKPTQSPRPSPIIDGYGSSDDHCPCRVIPNEKSFCYTMDKELELVGDCSKHKCADKYECVRGAKGLPDCLRRYAEYHVIKTGTNRAGHLQYERIKLQPKTEFWVLY